MDAWIALFIPVLAVIGYVLTILGKWRAILRPIRAGRKLARSIKEWAAAKRRSAIRRACVDAGMPTAEDLKGLRDDIEKRLSAPVRPPNLPASVTPPIASKPLWVGLKTIQRAGLKFDLSDALLLRLGKTDPHQVAKSFIDSNVQGPFCPRCHLTLGEWNSFVNKYVVADFCPQCQERRKIAMTNRFVYVDQLKKSVYLSVDGDVRDGNKIRDTDENELAS